MMKRILTSIALISLCWHGLVKANHNQVLKDKPNVIFISIDDLRPMLGVYGDELAKTPNIDRLSASGMTFKRAYAQFPICGPSRASVLTGLRPDTVGVTHNYIKFRDKIKNLVTLPQYFGQQGYNTAYVGKIFHHGDKDDELSWNWSIDKTKLDDGTQRPVNYAIKTNRKLQVENKKLMMQKYGEQAKYGLGRGPAVEGADVPDVGYVDGFNTQLTIETLSKMRKSSDKPIFFGMGFHKPHLPWIAPKKYWDMYQADEIALTTDNAPPIGGASMGLHASFELRTFFDVPNTGPLSKALQVKLKHAYLACVSYVDAQVGKLLDGLQQQNLLDNSVIVLWSDHGYHLGDKGIWGKASNYEIATRVPLIISTPTMRKQNKPLQTKALVELIDVYPTLTELANLPASENVDGKSLVPLFNQPELPFKTEAYSQFPSPAIREWGAFPLREGMRETYFGELIETVENKIKQQFSQIWDRTLFEKHLMGYSMRTEQYRFIAWLDMRDVDKAPIYMELYDHHSHPNETANIASEHEQLTAKLLLRLKQQLKLKSQANGI